jgi:hypothetical protein
VPILGRVTERGWPSPTGGCPAGPAVGPVSEPEAVAAAPLALWEADPALPLAALGLGIGSERTTEVDGGLLEHLLADLAVPPKASDLLGSGAVWGHDEHAPGSLTALPGVEGVDQVKPRPRHQDLRVGSPSGERVGGQPQHWL